MGSKNQNTNRKTHESRLNSEIGTKLITRRSFCESAVIAGVIAVISNHRMKGTSLKSIHLACNEYTWSVFYNRENRRFLDNLDEGISEVARSGLDGFEPTLDTPEKVAEYVPYLKKHGLEMRSFYVNSILHEKDQVTENIDRIVETAKKAKEFDTKIAVTNPSPIQWGTKAAKTDDQIKIQANALNELGYRLAKIGITLAYHNHDIELHHAAREFHHMMIGTDPETVTLCLDSHWIYRGSGNSSVALFDVIKLYAKRISELHIRQSKQGIWTETFGKGDIDYPKLVVEILKHSVKPHLVLEQAIEEGSPNYLSPLEAHKKSTKTARKIFNSFG